jgi:hypothetical protein
MFVRRIVSTTPTGLCRHTKSRMCYVPQTRLFQQRALSSSSEPVYGLATPDGTKRFVARSRLPLYHHFTRSNLMINPIIHGPPHVELVNKLKENPRKVGINCLILRTFSSVIILFTNVCACMSVCRMGRTPSTTTSPRPCANTTATRSSSTIGRASGPTTASSSC